MRYLTPRRKEGGQISAARALSALPLVVGMLAVGPARSADVGLTTPVASRISVSWGHAIAVPGLGSLDNDPSGYVTDLSCPSVGNCAAVGVFSVDEDDLQAFEPFVVNEVGGVWGHAEGVGGVPGLPTGNEYAALVALSCASAGNCSAAGEWSASNTGNAQTFVVNEVGGSWGTATQVEGFEPYSTWLGWLEFGPSLDSRPLALSCWSPGNCALGGQTWATSKRPPLAVVANELGGSWQPAKPLRGQPTNALDKGSNVTTISCSAGGACVAGGSYFGLTYGIGGAFLATGQDGSWGSLQHVTGAATLSTYRYPRPLITAVSCPASGNCTAVGQYTRQRGGGLVEGFFTMESDGKWGKVLPMPGLARLNWANVVVNAVSCEADDCTTAGTYVDGAGNNRAFIADDSGGRWANATEVPGVQGMGNSSSMMELSCSLPGDCAVVGSVATQNGAVSAYVDSELGGDWGRAELIPGLSALNPSGFSSGGSVVSCDGALTCVAGGGYSAVPGAFVTTG